jgi:hypothetical protein
MIEKRVRRAVKFAVMAVIATVVGVALVFVFGFVVMSLWNWLVPSIFAGRMITFWQALALLILCRILFGGFRGRPGHHMNWRRRMRDRWENMTPEEREKFRQGLHGRCGEREPSSIEPKVAAE